MFRKPHLKVLNIFLGGRMVEKNRLRPKGTWPILFKKCFLTFVSACEHMCVHVGISVCKCVYPVCVHTCTCAHAYVFMSMPWHMCGSQRRTLGVSPTSHFVWYRIYVFTTMDAKLAGPSFWEVLLSHPITDKLERVLCTTMVSFLWVMGTRIQILTVVCKLFVHRATSPALDSYSDCSFLFFLEYLGANITLITFMVKHFFLLYAENW